MTIDSGPNARGRQQYAGAFAERQRAEQSSQCSALAVQHVFAALEAATGCLTLRCRNVSRVISRAIGAPGEQNGTVYKITMGRSDFTVKEMESAINARMGLNTWAAFYGSDTEAVVAGDVAMLATEVTPVLKALRGNSIDIVATGVKAAVDVLGKGRGSSRK